MAKAEKDIILSVAHSLIASQIVDVRGGELSAAMYRVTMINEHVIIKFSLELMSCHFACSLLCYVVLLTEYSIYICSSKPAFPDVFARLHASSADAEGPRDVPQIRKIAHEKAHNVKMTFKDTESHHY